MKEKLPKDFIPDFDELYKQTCDFVREHQGEKGYIDTNNEDGKNDTIYGIFCGYEGIMEIKIHGVKCNGENLLIVWEVVTNDSLKIIFSDEDFKDAIWENVRYGDYLYHYTLMNIAEAIHEYV